MFSGWLISTKNACRARRESSARKIDTKSGNDLKKQEIKRAHNIVYELLRLIASQRVVVALGATLALALTRPTDAGNAASLTCISDLRSFAIGVT